MIYSGFGSGGIAESNDFDIILRADGTTLYAKKYINITEDIISKLQ